MYSTSQNSEDLDSEKRLTAAATMAPAGTKKVKKSDKSQPN